MSHRDHLCRIAYELVKQVLRYCHSKIMVCNTVMEQDADDRDELKDNLLTIIMYFGTESKKMCRRSRRSRRRGRRQSWPR